MAGTTTNYGWTYPTSTDYVKDGATAIQTLATGIDTTSAGSNLAGLVLIKSQTIGSAVASVTVTGAFSTTYESYKVIFHGGTASASNSINASINGITTGYYSILEYATFAVNTPGGLTYSNQNAWYGVGAGTTASANGEFDLHNPFASKPKWGRSTHIQVSTTGNCGYSSFMNTSTTSATDLTLTPSTGTITGGTIYIYGYRKAV